MSRSSGTGKKFAYPVLRCSCTKLCRMIDFLQPIPQRGHSSAAFTAIVINLLLWGYESWTLTAGQRQNLNVRFNIWIRAMSSMTKLDLCNHSIRDEEPRKRLGIESLSEILDRRRMDWMEKVANMPATLDDN